MEEGIAKGKSGMSAKWVIKDKEGNILDQGSEGTEEGEGEEAEK